MGTLALSLSLSSLPFLTAISDHGPWGSQLWEKGKVDYLLKHRLSHKGKLPLLGIVSEVVAEETVSEEGPGEGKEESNCVTVFYHLAMWLHNHADRIVLHIEYVYGTIHNYAVLVIILKFNNVNSCIIFNLDMLYGW